MDETMLMKKTIYISEAFVYTYDVYDAVYTYSR